MSALTRPSVPRTVHCQRSHIPGIAHYYVISTEVERSPAELWAAAGAVASALARDELGDPGAFALVFNGRATRRRPWPHVHVFLARTIAGRRWALCCYTLKHLTRWRRWGLLRWWTERQSRG
jgi:hypothetical protein